MRILRGRARAQARGRAIHSSNVSAWRSAGSNPVTRDGPGTGPSLANAVDLYRLRHELRTPLTGMLGLAELLSAQDLPGPAAIWLATLQACGQQMASLIDRSLRPDFRSGDTDSRAEPGIEGGAFLEQLICSHWPAAKAGNTQLYLLLEPQARAYWRADPVLLRQALDNLLANAIRFSPEGYVLLEACVRPSVKPGSGTLLLAVENSTGYGQAVDGKSASPVQITENKFNVGAAGGFDYADRAYRMFSRGQGLPVVEQVCDAFQGQFQRSQTALEGARFELQLPAVVSRYEKQSRPFGINLLRSLSCLLLLEEPQRRVVVALLACLDIAFSAIDKLEENTLHAFQENQLLICKPSSLPAAILGNADRFRPQSICLLARLSHADQSGWHVQVLSEPLLLVELQTALLRCLVHQGTAVRAAQLLAE